MPEQFSVTCAVKRMTLASVLAIVVLAGEHAAAAERGTDARLIAIREASDPSTAIEAYAEAVAGRINRATAAEAIVRRMVEFGLPEMVDAQARDLIQRDPRSAIGWSVVSYMETKMGRVDSALESLVRAVRLNADEVFVLQTAGQLLAWYDVQETKPSIREEVAGALVTIRGELDKHPIYTQVYEATKASYLAGAPGAPDAVAGQAAQPGAPGGVPVMPAMAGQGQFVQPPIVFNPVIQTIVQQPEQTGRVGGYGYPYWWYPVNRVVVVHPGRNGHRGGDGGRGGNRGNGNHGGGAGNGDAGAPQPVPVQTEQRGLRNGGPIQAVGLTGQTRASAPVINQPVQRPMIQNVNVTGTRRLGGVSNAGSGINIRTDNNSGGTVSPTATGGNSNGAVKTTTTWSSGNGGLLRGTSR